jgi:hypothetical protein
MSEEKSRGFLKNIWLPKKEVVYLNIIIKNKGHVEFN